MFFQLIIFAALEITSSGPSVYHDCNKMGRFDLILGEGSLDYRQQAGSAVYRQAHSREIPNTRPFFLRKKQNYRDDWQWIVDNGWRGEQLMVTVEEQSIQPPSTGWKFQSGYGADEKEDGFLTCRAHKASPSCHLTVTLSGAAKESQGKCAGQYKSTGLMSMGREVIAIVKKDRI